MKSFDEVYATLPGNGWLSEPEARLLWGSVNSTEGLILEVGCHYGRSTCLLAATGRQVICVDPWSTFAFSDVPGEEVFSAFCRNLEERGLRGNVYVNRMRIEDWTFNHTIGLAYLDGDHSYQGTVTQIDAALMLSSATIAIHDVNDDGGGLEVKKAALELLGSWDTRVERLAIWKR